VGFIFADQAYALLFRLASGGTPTNSSPTRLVHRIHTFRSTRLPQSDVASKLLLINMLLKLDLLRLAP
jgi:hypothetical protein